MALPPAAGLRIAVGLVVVVGSALRRCSVAGGVVAVGLSAALAAAHRTATDFEAAVAGAAAVVVGLCREAVVRLLQGRACTPRIVRRRRQRRFPLSDALVVRPTAVAAAAVTVCSRACGDNTRAKASHFHTVELKSSYARNCFLFSVQHGHELQRACHTPSTFVKYTLLPPILRPYNLRHLSTHSGEPVREELRREEALQLGGAPA